MIKNKGFTLFEILVVLVIIGIMTALISPSFNFLITSKREAYIQKEKLTNKKIVNGILYWVKEDATDGKLPSVYTDIDYASSVADPTNTALVAQIEKMAVEPGLINNDNSASERERVYHTWTDSASVPMYGSIGPVVPLNFEHFEIYTSGCPKTDTTCDPLLDENKNNGTTTVRSNTYRIQKDKLGQTVAILNALEAKLSEHFKVLKSKAAVSSTANFYPNPVDIGASSKAGRNPVTNSGCHDGWYGLDQLYTKNGVTKTICDMISLSPAVFGQTAWQGPIEYCRDYDPTATGTATAGKEPHNAAIRFRSTVTDGNPPSGTSSDNIIIPF